MPKTTLLLLATVLLLTTVAVVVHCEDEETEPPSSTTPEDLYECPEEVHEFTVIDRRPPQEETDDNDSTTSQPCDAPMPDEGRCREKEEEWHKLQQYNSPYCSHTMSWMKGRDFIVRNCKYHIIVNRDESMQVGVESPAKEPGIVYRTPRTVKIQPNAELRGQEMRLAFEQAMQICFFLDSGFDNVACPIRMVIGDDIRDLSILETFTKFPPNATWSDSVANFFLCLMECAADWLRSWRTDNVL